MQVSRNYKKCIFMFIFKSYLSRPPKATYLTIFQRHNQRYSVVQSTSSSWVTALFASCPNCSKQSTLESGKEMLILYNKILSSFKFLKKSYVSLRKYTKKGKTREAFKIFRCNLRMKFLIHERKTKPFQAT